MTTSTCHFLPLSAAKNIPRCNITTTKTRRKRFASVVSLAVAPASLGISVSNSLQIANLQQQVAVVEDSLSRLSQTVDIYGAQLTKFSLKQIKVIEELQVTQKAINDMIPVVNSHAEAINVLKTNIEQLNIKFQQSFLYSAITQICRNELTLSFLSPEDIQKVVYNVIKEGNLTFNSYPGPLPIVQIITKLLVRQQIDFTPDSHYLLDYSGETDNSEEIGRLVITSYFAVPQQAQAPFNIYKLMTIPFFHADEVVELTQIPRYWAINLANNTTMEWHNREESECDLQLMTSCRDTPPIRTMSKTSCLDEIVGNLPLSKCQTAPIRADKYFIRQLRDNLWITSSSKPIHCKNSKEQIFSCYATNLKHK